MEDLNYVRAGAYLEIEMLELRKLRKTDFINYLTKRLYLMPFRSGTEFKKFNKIKREFTVNLRRQATFYRVNTVFDISNWNGSWEQAHALLKLTDFLKLNDTKKRCLIKYMIKHLSLVAENNLKIYNNLGTSLDTWLKEKHALFTVPSSSQA